MSTTVQALMHEADHERLPVHAIQRIVATVAEALDSLHKVGIMHGAVKPENVYFWRLAYGTEDIKSVLDSEPRPTIRKNKIYLVVIISLMGVIGTIRRKRLRIGAFISVVSDMLNK